MEITTVPSVDVFSPGDGSSPDFLSSGVVYIHCTGRVDPVMDGTILANQNGIGENAINPYRWYSGQRIIFGDGHQIGFPGTLGSVSKVGVK